ncbi:MAG: rod shape-determining protein RodA [Butyrivibrio sp.]|jgi:rod shape determining protein RodA|uniref:FtsW/RodA/SpoVE family cell cycle protein n=1 Tax=Butyrivibrio sp. TaxID=28121 RepID=UPI001EC90624|nr:FtsW/RodA/SpoVE family cell cycle protein [Butyrivibrio sp.]MBE5840086.1 rod shape-determining protein RodA [Butyrivibrio sp.]
MLKKYKLSNYDFALLFMVIGLTIIGIFSISSAKPDFVTKQTAGMVFGIVVMIFLSLLDYGVILKLFIPFYALNIVLLALVLSPLGSTTNGAQRWISLLGITFQPSEAAKILLILFYAQFIMKYKDKVKNFGFVVICVILLAIPLGLIYMQPDLSTCIMLMLIFSSIMFVAGIDWRIVVAVLGVSIPAALFIIYNAVQEDSSILKDYQQRRILAWLHPEDYANAEAYQTLNSMMAIGSGQLYGKGYNTNEISSVLNGGFISESQTDFIFTVIGEEFGFVGSVIVIALVFAIAIECFIISTKAKDKAGELIAAGVGAWIGFQGFINVGVATGVLPNTGLPLPFVSYGLTSLLSVYAGIGFVLNVRLQGNKNLFGRL